MPTKPSPDGPLAILPPPIYQLPRAKPLPKPKPPTKWEKFAAAKGIQHKVRDKKVWDEEKQDWVNRWGRNGKNREVEEQWIHEVPLNAGADRFLFHEVFIYINFFQIYLCVSDVDYDPRKVARDERKERIAKNEKKHRQNMARQANPRQERKQELDRTLASTRISTASMGKFDKRLEGEKKVRGIKRKVSSPIFILSFYVLTDCIVQP